MISLISDLASKKIDAKTSNAICQAGGKLLKVVELQLIYGSRDELGEKHLRLDGGRKK